MKYFLLKLLWIGLLVAAGFGLSGIPAQSAVIATNASSAVMPRLFPDYRGVVIPPNMAPLNFRVEETGARYQVELRSLKGPPIALSSRKSSIEIPISSWRELLRANKGQPLYLDVSVQDHDKHWRRFQTVTNFIALEDIDGYLAYRLLKPLYNAYVNLGIYQRNLQTFQETPILENKSFDHDCLNCHTFLNHRSDTFAINIRTATNAHPMMLTLSNEVIRVNNTAGYLSWHPSGRLIAYSANKLSMFFHTIGETRDVFDEDSDLQVYRVDSNVVVNPPSVSQPDRVETWPSWSPDGRYLYFCSAPKAPFENFRKIRYDLMRVRYDIESDQWGQPETLVSSERSGLSASQPRVSPDGRFVLFCLAKYGCFPIYQTNSDLYVMNLAARSSRRLDINSDQPDTWHCWSQNGRWIVLSSKRMDGLFTRPHFSYVDAQGQFHKPFVLPQKDPAFYDSYLMNYNLPELVLEPVRVPPGELARGIVHPRNIRNPQLPAGAERKEPPASDSASETPPLYRKPTK